MATGAGTSALAISMFTTRQSIVEKALRAKRPLVSISISEFVLRQRSLRSLEVVGGIEKDTVVHADGSKVQSSTYLPTKISFADERVTTWPIVHPFGTSCRTELTREMYTHSLILW